MKTREIYLDFVRGIAILLAMGWHFNSSTTGIWVIDQAFDGVVKKAGNAKPQLGAIK